MLISILTLFPEIFTPYINSSIIGRAQKKDLCRINLINIRNFTKDRHKTVDDRPYGGGPGMILKVDILHKAIEETKKTSLSLMLQNRIILLDPKGKKFTQKKAFELSKVDHLILICGHYEGVDARIVNFADEIISIGDYILTGGEIAAMVISDCVIRLIPGVLRKEEATGDESFSYGKKFEAPQYTRPAVYKNFKVPKVLLSGNHQKIKEWRQKHPGY